jgi:hypothetical protein
LIGYVVRCRIRGWTFHFYDLLTDQLIDLSSNHSIDLCSLYVNGSWFNALWHEMVNSLIRAILLSYIGSGMSEVRCHYCGKVIENEKDMIMRNIQAGLLGLASERKPFHAECWRKYHGTKMKRDLIAYVAIGAGVCSPFFAMFWLLAGFGEAWAIPTVFCVALFIFLIVEYYRIEE